MLRSGMQTSIHSAHFSEPFPRAPNMQHGGMAVWFTHPAGLLVRFVEPARATLESSNWFVGPVWAELERRFPTQPLTIVADFSLMISRTNAARSVFLGKARSAAKRVAHAYYVVPHVMSTSQRFATTSAITLLQAIGMRIDIVQSADQAVRTSAMRAIP
jgi:hypothetical protein